MDDSLIVFQRDSGTEASSQGPVEPEATSDSSAIRPGQPSRRQLNRTTSTSDPIASSSWYLYIQMQLCSQMSLRDWLTRNNHVAARPPRSELYCMFWQIVDAVAYLHAHELMHRDLKPSNILFDSTNRLKLADFGLVTSFANDDYSSTGNSPVLSGDHASSAHRSTSDCTNPTDQRDSGTADSWNGSDREQLSSSSIRRKYFGIRTTRRHTDDVGTDLYMSPEQERHERYDRKVDIFSLGLIFLELLLPFETDMERICTLLQAKRQLLPDRFSADCPLEVSAGCIGKVLSDFFVHFTKISR
ncbi:unnamed protein product [Echinostoma caproni]|uniref:Protein kinase domain-containing protein n=1 Tax=Echinostoma caproni TaxID=27848 RepID=A0A183B956_9TREM|nr:unnamed protein product [Echinostoma caproni]